MFLSKELSLFPDPSYGTRATQILRKQRTFPLSPAEWHQKKHWETPPIYLSKDAYQRELLKIERQVATLSQEQYLSAPPTDRRNFPIKGIVLVGSWAHHNAHHDSDLDYFLLTPYATPYAVRDEFNQHLANATHRTVSPISIFNYTNTDYLLEELDIYGHYLKDGYHIFTHDNKLKTAVKQTVKKWEREG